MSPCFPEGGRLVDDRYETIALPGDPLPTERFHAAPEWNLDEMLAFITSWSGTQTYIEAHGADPVEALAAELEAIWGERERVRTVRWPLYLLASRP